MEIQYNILLEEMKKVFSFQNTFWPENLYNYCMWGNLYLHQLTFLIK